MSRIGKLPIQLPEGVTAVLVNDKATFTGPKGIMEVHIPKHITVTQNDASLMVEPKFKSTRTNALHGMTRSLLNNAAQGVAKEFEKSLEIKGVGFKAQIAGEGLKLIVGFSHPVEIPKQKNITFSVKGSKITISGMDKQQVGEVAATIRRIKPPDAYKGKGIRYVGEEVKLKPGKAAKTAGASA